MPETTEKPPRFSNPDHPVCEWWSSRDSVRELRVRWSPVQLWLEVGDFDPTFIVVKDRPTYGDVDRLLIALGMSPFYSDLPAYRS